MTLNNKDSFFHEYMVGWICLFIDVTRGSRLRVAATPLVLSVPEGNKEHLHRPA